MRAFGFLFWLFFVGIIVASLQDLKRREVDNWLNLFLLVASFSFIFFRAIFEGDGSIVFQAGFVLVIMFVVMNIFYYGRVFAGGDAKLLFVMTGFFISASFNETLVNVGIFVLFLIVAGSVYGLVYSFVLYIKDFEKVNKEIVDVVKKLGVSGWAFGVGLMLLGFFNWMFLVFGIFILLAFGLYVFAKGLEGVSMIRVISGKELREGDWLVDDVKVRITSNSSYAFLTEFEKKVGKKVIKVDWEGLSLDDIGLLKNRKKIKIKEGLPFVPAFLIAFLGYVFFKDWVMGLFMVF